MTFELHLSVGWRDVDGVGHMANTAYLDKAADARASFLAANGHSIADVFAAGISPFIMRDEVEYRRESRWGDPIRVTCELAAMSSDASHFTFRHEFFRDDTFLARVSQTGSWLLLAERALTVPPAALVDVFIAARSADFTELPSLLKAAAD